MEGPTLKEVLKPPEHHQRATDFVQKVEALSDDFSNLSIQVKTNLDLDETSKSMEEIAKAEGDDKVAEEIFREGLEQDAMLVDEAFSVVWVTGDKKKEVQRAVDSVMKLAKETKAIPARDYTENSNIKESWMKKFLIKIQGSIAEDLHILESTMTYTFRRLDLKQTDS